MTDSVEIQLREQATIKLTKAELIVLHEAIGKLGGSEFFEQTLRDAEKRAVWNLECECERLNEMAFSPDYEKILIQASALLLEA
ncbi:hypothetical protein [Roseibium sp.]|uniref:hypothetical protein n=1 Tax=Roseibium sp. TaxID=1936156 RepID=UPI003A979C2F